MNRLIHESSPYLLQHAHNPVDWYPWGDAALEKARNENKLLLVSIGYAACHWCHVMERECFEQEEVAQVMNEHFVCVKVDREERPDVDKVYMDAVMLMTGRGGWPLNAFALPDGRPIYGGTYYPKEHWLNVLRQLATMYQQQPGRAYQYAEDLTKVMGDMDRIDPAPQPEALTREQFAQALGEWLTQLDDKWGGRKVQANKFPLPQNNLCLLRSAFYYDNPHAHAAADLALEKMAFGGIYDHLGGGFARYSVDPYWKVPHFEKMLYDNAQLVSLYAEAWQQGGRERYRQVVYDTLDFVARELSDPEGGFYASLDADSEGVEGKFYTWSYEEVEQVLGDDARLFADYYNVHPFGNWEHTNILFVLEEEEDFAERWKTDPQAFRAQMARCRAALMAHRAARVRPGLDDKVLTSWNALMLKACTDAYRIFGEPRFLDMALRNARFIRDYVAEEGHLYRNYKAGRATIDGFLDDYAFVIEAYVSLYQVTFDEAWLRLADQHMGYVLRSFANDDSPLFFYTDVAGQVLVRRKVERQDDVIPSSNAVLAGCLYDLGTLLERPDYRRHAQAMLDAMQPELLKNPTWHARWCLEALRGLFPCYEVAITGDHALALRLDMEHYYYPGRVFAGATQPSELPLLQHRFEAGRDMIYVCRDYACYQPVDHVEAAAGQMSRD
ncbi:MAG: thioredoxin domain-containing protein [Bacteroidia bacterium]